MAEAFKLMCKAKARGYYADRLHLPDITAQDKQEKRAGQPFMLLADALRYRLIDDVLKMEVTKDLKPVLPSWVEPLEAVKPIDPKVTPHVIVDGKPKRMGRRVTAEAAAAAQPAWPKNQKKRDSTIMDENRPIRLPKGTAVADEGDDD